MLECIKREDLKVDERFSTRPDRASNSLELLEILDKEFVKFNWKDLENLFKDSGVTFGPISEPNDHINDTQIRENNFFKEYSDNKGLYTVDSPLYMSNEAKKEPEMAPEIGANTYSILTELGYNNEDIKVLEERKIIKT